MSEVIELKDKGEIADILARLEKGEEVKVKIGEEEITYRNLPEPTPICDNHFFEFAGMEDDVYAGAKCRDCINGRIYNTKTHEIKNGEIVNRH